MELSEIILPLTGLGIGFVVLIVLTPKVLREQKTQKNQKTAFEFSCPTCQRNLNITRASLDPILGPRAALVIQSAPDAPMHHLAEQRCQGCKSMLTFATDIWPPEFLIANAGESQRTSNSCVECRKPLVRPSWPRGMYDERIKEIPNIDPKLGLKCSRCDAVSCVACLEYVTRNRTEDGSYLCPRCFRSPVNLVHHF